MEAGRSALQRSRVLHERADTYLELSTTTRREAEAYVAASASERALAGRLAHLTQLGWTVLEDRRWPASQRANVDFVLVGPGGIVVLDAKAWSDPAVRDDTLWCGQADTTDEVEKLERLGDQISDAVAPSGLCRSAISAAMVFTGRRLRARVGAIELLGVRDVVCWLTRLPPRLSPSQVVELSAAVAEVCPPMPSEPPRATAPAPTGQAGRHRAVPARLEPTEALLDTEELTHAMLTAALATPLEEWMTFLHPDQNRLVRTTWHGPARVRGPAGTGKTVVGLHRAVHLAQRSEHPVLFVSFVRTLPVVLGSLARRLSPEAAERIEFVNVHRLALRCLEAVGRRPRLDPSRTRAAFDHAWDATSAGRHLGRLDTRPDYWREEIDHVIKGRGLASFEEYAVLARVGRRTRMAVADRRVMWTLYEAYEQRLAQLGLIDFNDLLIEATAVVERLPELFRYSAVVVDEVQDLGLAAVRLLVALADAAGDGPNRLLLIGDGQQSVYPGGFTLAEAGISVAGRAAVLAENYRNTAEILDVAMRLVGRDTFDDLDELPEAGDRDVRCLRRGHTPLVVSAGSRRRLGEAVTTQIRATHDVLDTPWGHLAVLLERVADARYYRDVLRRAGIPVVDLTDYDGTSTDRVKVGTIKRAKGLEFGYVLLPGLSRTPPPRLLGETDDSHGERVERWRRELYVGMTRARDGLWLGYLDPPTG